ncbi:MAG: HNH endonuclease [Myroides sp.]
MDNLSIEIWKEVEEFNNKYEISNLGNLRSKTRRINSSIQPCGYRISPSREIKSQDNGNSYKQFYVSVDAKRVMKYSHRLVAKYFIPNPNNLPEVNHIDGDKGNNSVSNLEWVTLQQNRDHASENGLMQRGEKHKLSKLSETQIIAIRRLFRINPQFNKLKTAKKLGVRDTTIHKIIKNQRWKHLV